MSPNQANGTPRLIDTVEHAQQRSPEAVRNLLDTVDSAVPRPGDDGPRRKIIDSGFEMTERLAAASTRLVQNVLDVTEKALSESDRVSDSRAK